MWEGRESEESPFSWGLDGRIPRRSTCVLAPKYVGPRGGVVVLSGPRETGRPQIVVTFIRAGPRTR